MRFNGFKKNSLKTHSNVGIFIICLYIYLRVFLFFVAIFLTMFGTYAFIIGKIQQQLSVSETIMNIFFILNIQS